MTDQPESMTIDLAKIPSLMLLFKLLDATLMLAYHHLGDHDELGEAALLLIKTLDPDGAYR